jgi:hypothetical protein
MTRLRLQLITSRLGLASPRHAQPRHSLASLRVCIAFPQTGPALPLSGLANFWKLYGKFLKILWKIFENFMENF